ncbi:MAG: hypothetical protein H6631_07940 [Anaerolineaceae bacterium]|nr:hypothetical protein [Anaerolineaceae bacterium]MCB9101423.1 hypothetical protein [Anaerolineales bacterium]
MVQTRLISFAGNTLTLNFEGATAARVIDLLYRHVEDGDPESSCFTYHLEENATSEWFTLQRGQELLYEGDDAGLAGEVLLSDSCYQLAALSRTGLLFHAAVLRWQGHGLILPGPSGTGKSTLTAWLVSHGFDYLSDELALVPWQTDLIKPFTRPINLKSPARAVLEGVFDFEANKANILTSPYGYFVPPQQLRFHKPQPETPLKTIIFPQYCSDSNFEYQLLSKAQAGLALMQTLINARNLPEHGFQEVTRLARQVPAYTLKYSHFDHVAEYIKDVCSSGQAVRF